MNALFVFSNLFFSSSLEHPSFSYCKSFHIFNINPLLAVVANIFALFIGCLSLIVLVF